MKYEEFKNEVVEAMKRELGDDYEGFKYDFQIIKKAGSEYEALSIIPNDRKICMAPVLNMTKAWEDFNDGTPFADIVEHLIDVRKNASIPGFNKEDLLSFDKVKDRILPRIINTEANLDYIKDKVSNKLEDLTIIYEVRIQETVTGCASAIITEDLMNAWDVEKSDIHFTAFDNLDNVKPLFQNLTDVLFNPNHVEEIESIDPDDYDAPFFILTNENKTKGAVMVLCNKVMEKISKQFGGVYIIPSSVDEVIILPKCYAGTKESLDGLRRMVTDINANDIKPKDRLSNNIYTWTLEDGFQLA